MVSGKAYELTVNLSDLELATVTPELRQEHAIPAETAGVVIVSIRGGEDDASSEVIRGGVISRMISDRYELFIDSADDVPRGAAAMKRLGDSTALLRLTKAGNRYNWINVRLNE